MKDTDKERIIEDLLFEAASRKSLQAQTKAFTLKRYISYAVAAILVLGIFAISGLLNFQDGLIGFFKCFSSIISDKGFPKIAADEEKTISVILLISIEFNKLSVPTTLAS